MAQILLADDDAASVDLVRRALESDGHCVHVTQDGSDALEIFKAGAGSFDLIVTDVEMPGLDGVSFAKEALALSPRIKVLMMSGFAEQLERGRWLEPARLGILPKPFTLEQFRAAIRTALK